MLAEHSLFDEIERSDLRSAFNAEPKFHYLNVSARRSAGVVRAQVDAFYHDMPDNAKRDVRSRFRSADDNTHLGAFTELYCLALLRRHGFEVEIHRTSSKGTRIDFLATKSGRPAFVLECVASGEEEQESRASSLVRGFYDSLNRLQHPDIYLTAQLVSIGAQAPSARRARRFLQPLLDSVDWKLLWNALKSRTDLGLPTWVWQDNAWEFHFVPMARPPELRGLSDIRMVSAQVSKARSTEPGLAWRAPLLKKAWRYGRPEIPYVIAINGAGMFHNKANIPDALFGSRAANINLKTKALTPTRIPNGLWVGSRGTRYTRVSAVLFLERLNCWSMAQRDPVLWHNPWAAKRLEVAWWSVPQYVPEPLTETMQELKVITGAELFNLGPEWPGED